MRRLLIFIMAAALAFSVPITVPATEYTSTGDVAVQCMLTVSLTDDTGEYPGGSITVNMTDVTGTLSAKTTISPGKSVSLIITGPTTYSVSFEGLADGYGIVGAEGGDDLSFAAIRGDRELELHIVKTAEEEAEAPPEEAARAPEEPEETEPEEPQDATEEQEEPEEPEEPEEEEPEEAEPEEPEGEKSGGGLGEEEASELFERFLSATSVMEEDSAWDTVFQVYDTLEDRYGAMYLETVEGATWEQWEAMTPYERFVVTESYTRYAYYAGRNPEYFEDRAVFRAYVTPSVESWILQTDSEKMGSVYQACVEMADAQYGETAATGEPYDFLSEGGWLAEINARHADMPEEAGEKEDGIWAGTLKVLRGNIATLAVLAGLVIAVLAIYIRRRRYNMD